MSKRPIIERRTRFYLGCEGESEQAYGAFLQRLCNDAGLSVQIVARNLQPAGDPNALARRAVADAQAQHAKAPIAGRAILIDADRLADLADRGQAAQRMLDQARFVTIWQHPDHEGFLLRHLPGHGMDDPPRGMSLEALQAVWPRYHKAMASRDLGLMLDQEAVLRAGRFILNFQQLLQMIGLTQQP